MISIAIVIVIIVLEFALIWASREWLHLSFKCPVCKLEYSKTLPFVLGNSSFRCPFCKRIYTIQKIGSKCIFRGQPLSQLPLKGEGVIVPFEVEWEKPFLPLKDSRS